MAFIDPDLVEQVAVEDAAYLSIDHLKASGKYRFDDRQNVMFAGPFTREEWMELASIIVGNYASKIIDAQDKANRALSKIQHIPLS